MKKILIALALLVAGLDGAAQPAEVVAKLIRATERLQIRGRQLDSIVVAITGSSTDRHSPTAKAVYDYVQSYSAGHVILEGDTPRAQKDSLEFQSNSSIVFGASNTTTRTVVDATIASNAVDSSKIAAGGVSVTDIGQHSASSGQVLKWNGTQWAPAADSNGAATVGDLTAASSKITVTGGTGAVIGAGATVDVNEANLTIDNIPNQRIAFGDGFGSALTSNAGLTTGGSNITVGSSSPATLSSSSLTISTNFTVGNSANNLTVGGSTGSVIISSSAASTSAISLSPSNAAGSATVSGGTMSHSSGLFRVMPTITGSPAVAMIGLAIPFGYTQTASGAGTFSALSINGGVSLSGAANQVVRGIDINPSSLTLASGSFIGLDVRNNNTAGFAIRQSGTSALNHFAGHSGFGTATPGSNILHVSGATQFDLGSDASGDIFYRNSGGAFSRLGIGSGGQFLSVSAGLPAWVAISAASADTSISNNLLPHGTNKWTVRHNGTAWVADSMLRNDGTTLGIGVEPASTHKLTIKQTGATNSTNGLAVRRSGDTTNIAAIYHDGAATFESVGGNNLTLKTASGSLLLFRPGGGAGQIRQVSITPMNNVTSVENNASLVGLTGTFAPTASGGDFSIFNAEMSINQTGSANGITRGLNLKPTLTAVANEFRGVEYIPSTQVFLYQAAGTDVRNHLIGNLGIGTGTTTPAAKIDIVGNGATSGTDALIVKNSTPTTILRTRNDGMTIGTGFAVDNTAPSITYGTAAGTGPATDICNGGQNGFQLYFTTGTSPGTNASIFTATLPKSFPNGCAVTFSPGSAATLAVMGGLYISGTGNNSLTLSTTGTLTASTQYVLHFTITGY